MAMFAKAQAFLASGRVYDDIQKGVVERAGLNPTVVECVDFYNDNKSKPDAAKYKTVYSVCQVAHSSFNCSRCC